MKKTPDPKREDRTGESTSAQIIFRRTMILMVLFGVVAFIPLAWQLYQLQIVQHDELQTKATKQQTSDVSVTASRGTIYDTNGKTLAVSATVYNVILSPKDIHDISDASVKEQYGEAYDAMTEEQIEMAKTQMAEERIEMIATNLSSMLEDVEYADIIERCQSTTSMYSLVKRKVEAEDATVLREFIERYELDACIYLTNDTKRYYPYASTGATVLGFVNSNNDGAFGLEAYYNDELSGSFGRVVTAKTSLGTDLLYYFSEYYDAEDGNDVQLTIDTTIQYYCEQTLESGIEKYNVLEGGWVIAMDPNTGAVLGMASSPTYDANNPSVISDNTLLGELEDLLEELDRQVEAGEITQSDADTQYAEAQADALEAQWTNQAVNTTYEPGSTFKSLVLAAALEEGVVDEDYYGFYCSGAQTLDIWEIHCSSRYGHGQETLAEVVSNSCNLAFMDIGTRLGAQTFWDYMEAFGLMDKTGIEVAGETTSSWWPEAEFTSASGFVNLATASFGQRFEVSPIQLITAVAASVNGGYLYQPHLVKSITDSDGNTLMSNGGTVVRQVISEDSSATVGRLLEGVVDGGGGSNAYQAGYRIGGKTGTAEIGSTKTHYVVSFVGFAPANDPQIIVLVAFNKPELVEGSNTEGTSGYRVYGATMAASLAGELIAEICDYMGIEKQYSAGEEYLADSTMPSVIGMDESAAEEALRNANLYYRTVGSGETVTGQIPASGVTLANSSEVILYMGEEVPQETVQVPDLAGKTKSEAREILEDLGLYYKASGVSTSSGVTADGQSVSAGISVNVGTVITVHFSNQTLTDADGSID